MLMGHPQQPRLQMLPVGKGLAAAQQGLKDLLGHILRVLHRGGVVAGRPVNRIQIMLHCVGEGGVPPELHGHGSLSFLPITHLERADDCTEAKKVPPHLRRHFCTYG